MAQLKELTPPVFFGEAFPNKQGVSPGISSLATGSAGLVIGAAGAAILTGLGKGKPIDKDGGSHERPHDKEV